MNNTYHDISETAQIQDPINNGNKKRYQVFLEVNIKKIIKIKSHERQPDGQNKLKIFFKQVKI